MGVKPNGSYCSFAEQYDYSKCAKIVGLKWSMVKNRSGLGADA